MHFVSLRHEWCKFVTPGTFLWNKYLIRKSQCWQVKSTLIFSTYALRSIGMWLDLNTMVTWTHRGRKWNIYSSKYILIGCVHHVRYIFLISPQHKNIPVWLDVTTKIGRDSMIALGQFQPDLLLLVFVIPWDSLGRTRWRLTWKYCLSITMSWWRASSTDKARWNHLQLCIRLCGLTDCNNVTRTNE